MRKTYDIFEMKGIKKIKGKKIKGWKRIIERDDGIADEYIPIFERKKRRRR